MILIVLCKVKFEGAGLDLVELCLCVCLSVCYSQMKKNHHKTFRITLFWPIKMIYDVKDVPIL